MSDESNNTEPERYTRDEWEQLERDDRRQRDCAAVSHAPSAIVRAENGEPAESALCSCGLISWSPSYAVTTN